MLNGSIRVMSSAYNILRKLPLNKAKAGLDEMKKTARNHYIKKEKKDTRFFDAVVEEAICYGHEKLFMDIYNQKGIIITEEQGKIGEGKINSNCPLIISDPIDNSAYLEKRINEGITEYESMGALFDSEAKRAELRTCTSSLTLIKNRMIKYSLVLNLFTGELFVAYEKGIFSENIEHVDELRDISKKAAFHANKTPDLLCYSEGKEYKRNIKGTHLDLFTIKSTDIFLGGPYRFAYLMGKRKEKQIGATAFNGEKIQESLPNIAIALFSKKELKAYKLFCDKKYSQYRGAKEMTPSLENSIYNSKITQDTNLNVSFFNDSDYPSEFRDTVVIIPSSNNAADSIMQVMVQKKYAIEII